MEKYAVQDVSLDDFNCGGLALNNYSWYMPFEGDDIEVIEEEVANFIEEGWNLADIYEFLSSQFTDYMLRDIDGLRVIDSKDELEEDERLIYFRFFVELISKFDDDWTVTIDEYDYVHTDFHYKFFENGHWYEKCGVGDIEQCDGSADDKVWINGVNTYDSPIIKFALKVDSI